MTFPGPSAAPRRPASTAAVQIDVVTDAGRVKRPDRLVTEEPLEIRVHGPGEEPRPVAVTMRTPGSDFDLASGFLITEGVVEPGLVESIAYCLGGDGEQIYNVVTVRCSAPVHHRFNARDFAATAACGVCGKASLDDLEVRCAPVGEGPRVAFSVLASLPDRLRDHQRVFDTTGGLHAAARFSAGGELLGACEDIGRHNALDKLVGGAARTGELPLSHEVLMLSGRAGFELVQKAAVAGFAIVAAVSAPSSLALATAQRFDITLVGFLRDGRANIYNRADRIVGP